MTRPFSTLSQMLASWDFPGGPVVRTLSSQCRWPGFHPWSGNKIPHATTKSLHAATKTRGSQIYRKYQMLASWDFLPLDFRNNMCTSSVAHPGFQVLKTTFVICFLRRNPTFVGSALKSTKFQIQNYQQGFKRCHETERP